MHVVIATDGSHASLEAARQLKSFAGPEKIDDVTVVAVVSPLAAVPFINELRPPDQAVQDPTSLSFREEAEVATRVVGGEFEEWGASVHRQVRSGSAAAEIVRAAEELSADLIVVASGSAGLTQTVLLGSTAQRVQHSAPCPVLVWRPKAQ
ncbi:universal stress protein [Quadrisphaera sp. DSM 44207]|uniref:universal stress protein n=1 Tax=Quadrisphaera sp. DSM 44207 TaxID=1881057 RepID=UPI00088ED90E|nr:universal stress protein [Quadrisphaera sp. DSM 44207]SDQ74771.1 Nucleotide-binding universal stress protein, UspA family [Quadrisphaera sp. DSM 44207]